MPGPWMNGMDVTRRLSDKWIVDFGWNMVQEEAALYEAPFQHDVYPMRQRNRRESHREHWWRHVEPRQGMWRALDGLSRYIATPRVAKHRLFTWLDARIRPDSQLITAINASMGDVYWTICLLTGVPYPSSVRLDVAELDTGRNRAGAEHRAV